MDSTLDPQSMSAGQLSTIPLNLDGDPYPLTPIHVSVQPKALSVFTLKEFHALPRRPTGTSFVSHLFGSSPSSNNSSPSSSPHSQRRGPTKSASIHDRHETGTTSVDGDVGRRVSVVDPSALSNLAINTDHNDLQQSTNTASRSQNVDVKQEYDVIH